MFKLLKFLWNCFTSKKTEPLKVTKELIPPELPPYKPTTKQRLESIERYCDEVRKDLWIKKKTDDRLYVEMGNLKDKIERFIDNQK